MVQLQQLQDRSHKVYTLFLYREQIQEHIHPEIQEDWALLLPDKDIQLLI